MYVLVAAPSFYPTRNVSLKPDYTTAIFLATLSECALSVICASLPAMRPILDHPFFGASKNDLDSQGMALNDELPSFVQPQSQESAARCISVDKAQGSVIQDVGHFVTTTEYEIDSGI